MWKTSCALGGMKWVEISMENDGTPPFGHEGPAPWRNTPPDSELLANLIVIGRRRDLRGDAAPLHHEAPCRAFVTGARLPQRGSPFQSIDALDSPFPPA